ncbi:hypothetical protein QFC21_002293 [Naganishia friedmannii]|uniref:Uncharacterized protein n=1 Tax=Naganishia friedmannii TaxID=89922 RepID=A0ACC2VYD6_9TREE|nr:hypothetical protein QFC21_002293 [Naganishia friedmannii]
MPKDTPIDETPFQMPAGEDDLPAVVPETGQAGEQSKVRIILGLLKRIGDSTDEFERMLSVLRFAFSKELKFVRQRIGKPYNSALASKTSGKGAKSAAGGGVGGLKSSMSSLSIQQGASDASGSGNNANESAEQVVVFLCEQVSHHPPISSAYYACPGKGVEMTCVDQISAKVSGMTVQVTPGEANKGLFISLKEPSLGAGEEYQVTHPIAQVNGILKGTFYGTIGDKITVTCRGGKPGKTKLKAIIEYRDESWLGKPKFALEGIIYNYNPDKPEEEEWSKIKQVPSDRVVANVEGSWRKQIKYRRKGEKEWTLLIDLAQLGMTPRSVRPLSEQEERESRRLWDPVTAHMVTKNWNEATKQKQSIEQRQRDIAHELKQKGIEYVNLPSEQSHKPAYFEQDISSGKPVLSEQGRKAVEAELERARREVG